MFGIIRKNKTLEEHLKKLNANMENNYKDNAQENYRAFLADYEKLKQEGKLKPAQIEYYDRISNEYAERLNGFTHKDQKPYWQ